MKLRALIAQLVIHLLLAVYLSAHSPTVPQFSKYEAQLMATGRYKNPYRDLAAQAVLTEPDGVTLRSVPLFWDGGSTWKFRFAPDKIGTWKWQIQCTDQGLGGKVGEFVVTKSDWPGRLQPMSAHPHHFERQNGSPFWFLGDTAWAFFTDSQLERLDRGAAERYIDRRVTQGFNLIHTSLLSEAGWGNSGGLPFADIATERINPAYWQEVDQRLAYANDKGLVVGLAIAWGDKRGQEPFAWRRFPSIESRQRYARYIAARYSAYDVYFIVAGEWHAEANTRGTSPEEIRREFFAIGDALRAADPHARMMAIHPMTADGSVREFNEAAWMSFGDYQQNYRRLHDGILRSRSYNKPVVNAEYGYYLRDQNGDGIPDKDNSTSLAAIRHATWDIVMAGGYAVTGFGTTYFGGNRDPGPFDLEASKNEPWGKQVGYLKRLFTSLPWWELEPHDELLQCATPRGADRREEQRIAPPATTYWCLAQPGKHYVVYVRGLRQPVTLSVDGGALTLKGRRFNPRTGEWLEQSNSLDNGRFIFLPPDEEDWIIVLN